MGLSQEMPFSAGVHPKSQRSKQEQAETLPFSCLFLHLDVKMAASGHALHWILDGRAVCVTWL